jgi:REP element-mobilizing transposase RayT
VGGTWFLTVNLAERDRTTLIDHVGLLRAVMREVRGRHPFHIDAIVVLPDRLNAIWTLPAGDDAYPMRWALVKAGSSSVFRKVSGAGQVAPPRASGAYGSGATGSMRFEMSGITEGMWITSTTTRSSTVEWSGRQIGRIRASTSTLQLKRWIGIGVVLSEPTESIPLAKDETEKQGPMMARSSVGWGSLRSFTPTCLQGHRGIAGVRCAHPNLRGNKWC